MYTPRPRRAQAHAVTAFLRRPGGVVIVTIIAAGKPRVLVCGVSNNYGGTEVVVDRFIHELSGEVAFDYLATEGAPRLDGSRIGENRCFALTAKHRNPLAFERELRALFHEHAKEYRALWHNVNNLSNIDYLRLACDYGIPNRIIHAHSAYWLGGWLQRALSVAHRGKAAAYATRFLACSAQAGEFFFPGQEVEVVWNAFDLGSFAFDEDARRRCRRELGLGNAFVIGTTGRLVEEKNQRFLIELMPSLLSRRADVRLVIVGEGVLEQELKGLADRLGVADAVVFTGARNDVSSLLCAFDVFAFPSLFEGLGVSLVEAQASGLCCVASDRVPRVAAASGSVAFLPLDDAGAWVDALLGRSRADFIPDEASLSRFDIKRQAQVLKGFLLSEAQSEGVR